jgi:hypothetical protein
MSPRIGVEYKLKRNISLYNEIGTFIPNANGMSNNVGFLIKTEFKNYINKRKLTSKHYVSAELFYKQQSYYTYDSIYFSGNGYVKDYHVSKNVLCFTIKYGYLHILPNNIVVDFFVGVGVRQRFVVSSLTSEENSNIQADNSSETNILKSKAGTFTYPNFDAGIKIGYRFR